MQKKFGGGKSQECKGVFCRGAARLTVLGGGAELRHFAGNGFEFRCKIEPYKESSFLARLFVLLDKRMRTLGSQQMYNIR